MLNDTEKNRVLRVVQDGREIEGLVNFRIPYSRILLLLRDLLEDGLLEVAGAELRLTPAGHAALATPPGPGKSIAPPSDPLASARVPRKHPDAVHLPPDEVG